MTNLSTAIARLQALRHSTGDDGVVDTDSGLTAVDLDLILAQLRRATDVAIIEAEIAHHLSGR